MTDKPSQFSGRVLRVTFVHAPDPVYADTQNYGAMFMPVWAYTLGAHIPDDGRFRLALHDCRFEPEGDLAQADVFLFSGINQDCENLKRVRSRLKMRYPSATSIIGGPICWSFDQAGSLEQIGGFDHVFIGNGEDEIAGLLDHLYHGRALDRILRAKKSFPIAEALPFHRPMLDSTVGRYYGAVLEVSRGCPFLCEFCDIRVLPDNNRAHNKSSELIVSELDHLSRLGVNQVLFACDNFIGEPRWADEVIDRILEWQERTGFRPSLYTWLTVNLYKHASLMAKMRRAGFDMLFIGVESFSRNSLPGNGQGAEFRDGHGPGGARNSILWLHRRRRADLRFRFRRRDLFRHHPAGAQGLGALVRRSVAVDGAARDPALPADEAFRKAQGSALRPRRVQVPDQHQVPDALRRNDRGATSGSSPASPTAPISTGG